MSSFRSKLVRAALGAPAGLLAAFTALAVAELVAGLVRPAAGPVTAVGGAVIDRTPAAVKDFAIRTFGENDKIVLQLGILAILALIAVGLGILAMSHRRAGAAGVLLFGIVGAAAALSRPDSTGAGDLLPSVAGAVAGAVALYVLATEAAPVPAPADAGGQTNPGARSRRGFLAAAGVTAVAATSAGALGRYFTGRQGRGAVASREGLVLPGPASPAPSVPAGVQLKVPGITAFTTPNADFYRVDTALTVPKVDAGTWRLRVHGKGVSRPRTYTLDQLLARPLIERDITLTCVSNEVGGPYIGNARWLGVPLADLLEEAGVRPPSKGGRADQLVARSVDGMTLGTPVEDVMDGRDAMLAVGMNGEPLPFEHGFPVRMLVPGLYGYVSACKWIEDIELSTFDAYDPYWVKRKWARRAPIKTQVRIDTPKPFARPAAGTVTVAGVAWAQRRGITRVQIRVDDGPWQDADLARQAGVDTWRQWSYRWQATPGGHTLTVRATDGTGQVQTEQRTRTIPDGASGWHSVFVTVP
ncbi:MULTISPECIES: molybdopterin-dependent oxidoreductase [unclassified Streptomyces]|uniref:molybdopterin-dependent oxidoreductase n=1 Tax=unclassified Streptomyces TaxID=2593676 RepID=UPI0006F5CA44|nr:MULTISPECIES: molybdopterin-dependent oxidoreductase [unclassified Streptomyces]KQX56244.1 molybdopterin-binding oxidoreductase [Streptomyces sp. Root1304]KRA97060.1 molybdopterin-binding oxidoreductase [Streptomyces sp. Root66D1]